MGYLARKRAEREAALVEDALAQMAVAAQSQTVHWLSTGLERLFRESELRRLLAAAIARLEAAEPEKYAGLRQRLGVEMRAIVKAQRGEAEVPPESPVEADSSGAAAG